MRQALARAGGVPRRVGSPRHTLAESQEERCNGQEPWWIYQGASILPTIFVPPFSKMTEDLQPLRDQLSIYRLALAQPDQEARIHALQRRCQKQGRTQPTFWHGSGRPGSILHQRSFLE